MIGNIFRSVVSGAVFLVKTCDNDEAVFYVKFIVENLET